MAAVGLQCADLPEYKGPDIVPAGRTIFRKRITHPLMLGNRVKIKQSCMQPTETWRGLPLLSTTNYNTMKIVTRPVSIVQSDVDGSLLGDEGAAKATAFIGIANLRSNFIHNVGSGIGLMGTGMRLSATIENNYITGLKSWGDPRTDGTHADAFTIRDFDTSQHPDRSLIVRNNRFDCDTENATGAFFISTYSGNIDTLVATGNLLEGYGYQLPLGAGFGHSYQDLHFRNNRFSGTGYGPGYVASGPGWSGWSENYIDKPGKAGHRGKKVPEPKCCS